MCDLCTITNRCGRRDRAQAGVRPLGRALDRRGGDLRQLPGLGRRHAVRGHLPARGARLQPGRGGPRGRRRHRPRGRRGAGRRPGHRPRRRAHHGRRRRPLPGRRLRRAGARPHAAPGLRGRGRRRHRQRGARCRASRRSSPPSPRRTCATAPAPSRASRATSASASAARSAGSSPPTGSTGSSFSSWPTPRRTWSTSRSSSSPLGRTPRPAPLPGGYRLLLRDRPFLRPRAVNVAMIGGRLGRLRVGRAADATEQIGASTQLIGLLFFANARHGRPRADPGGEARRGRRRAPTDGRRGAPLRRRLPARGRGGGSSTCAAPTPCFVTAAILVGVGECLHTTVLMPLVADLTPPRRARALHGGDRPLVVARPRPGPDARGRQLLSASPPAAMLRGGRWRSPPRSPPWPRAGAAAGPWRLDAGRFPGGLASRWPIAHLTKGGAPPSRAR